MVEWRASCNTTSSSSFPNQAARRKTPGALRKNHTDLHQHASCMKRSPSMHGTERYLASEPCDVFAATSSAVTTYRQPTAPRVLAVAPW